MRLVAALVVLVAAGLGPFALAQAGGWNGQRPFAQELGSTLGIAALSVLVIVLMLPTRLRVLTGLGADAAVRLHRHLVGALLALIMAHVVLAVVLQPPRLGLLRFVGQPWRAQAAVGSVACLAALIAVSVKRRRLRLAYAHWRAVHGGLAAATLVLAAAHTFGWHRYLGHGAGLLGLAGMTVLPVGALVALRGRRRRHTTYVLDEVVSERGATCSIWLRAEDGRGRRFEPGQFAWLHLADAPRHFTEHPFSYASSSEDTEHVRFTVRAYDGFSAQIARLAPGTRLTVDGPHGAFRLRARARGVLLVAYGIGITPSMSILRTAADRGDRRPYLLVYANRDAKDVTFAEELSDLQRHLDLSVVHTLSRPAPAWAGERGRITPQLLQRHLPDDIERWDFFICGATKAADAGVRALAALDIPPERVHAERFVEV